MSKDRVRKVDIDSMPSEEIETLGTEMMKKISIIGKEASEKVNKITGIYGLSANVLIQFVDAKTGQIIS